MEKSEINSKIKEVLFKYCPYTEDRLDLIDHVNPEFDIHIQLGKDFSNILFVYGTHRAKQGVEGRILENRVMELEEIEELIDFIKSDHDAMFYDKHDTNNKRAEFKFDIRWGGDENIKGINCGTIGLILNYRDNPELGKKYLYHINEKYKLNDLRSEWEYTDSVFSSYIDLLDKPELLDLLSKLEKEDLKRIIKPNMREIFESCKDNPKIKELFK